MPFGTKKKKKEEKEIVKELVSKEEVLAPSRDTTGDETELNYEAVEIK